MSKFKVGDKVRRTQYLSAKRWNELCNKFHFDVNHVFTVKEVKISVMQYTDREGIIIQNFKGEMIEPKEEQNENKK